MSAQDHSLVSNEQQGNPHNTGQTSTVKKEHYTQVQ